MNLVQHILILALRVYRGVISPVLTALFTPLGFGCRYTPTCSQYALEAVRVHGALRGSWLAGCRVCRCHPWGGCGEDPVPPRQSRLRLSTGRILTLLPTDREPSRLAAASKVDPPSNPRNSYSLRTRCGRGPSAVRGQCPDTPLSTLTSFRNGS